MPFLILFLIQSYHLFTDSYHLNYENMRNENEKSWFFVKFRAFLFLNMPCLYFII